jgi:hypothetical protein
MEEPSTAKRPQNPIKTGVSVKQSQKQNKSIDEVVNP